MEKEHLKAPNCGDIIYINLNPVLGHEQGEKRLILVISEERLNQKTHIAICVPITSKHKEYSTEVSIQAGSISGCVLCNHIKSVDWAFRGYTKVETLSYEDIKSVKNIMTLIIQGEN